MPPRETVQTSRPDQQRRGHQQQRPARPRHRANHDHRHPLAHQHHRPPAPEEGKLAALLALGLLVFVLLGFLLAFTLFMGRIGNYGLLIFAPIAGLAVLVSISSARAAGRERERARAAAGAVRQAPLGGVWEGTARIWPSTPDQVLRLLPIRVYLGGRPLEAELLPCIGRQDREYITAIDLLEYDPTHRHLDLSVTVDHFDHHETFTARLCRASGTRGVLVPEDDSDTFTLELHRQPV